MSSRPLHFLSLCLLLAACATQRRPQRAREAPGTFDYYLLALTGAPAFCAHETTNRSARECGSGRELGFVVHGLWPEREGGHPLENCRPGAPVSAAIIQDMLPVMPDPALIQHEWRTHGSCTGLSPGEYFTAITRTVKKVSIPGPYRALHTALQTTPGEIERRFGAVNHFATAGAVRVQCRDGELREVRICLSKDLEARPCPRGMRDCRAVEVFMRPVQ